MTSPFPPGFDPDAPSDTDSLFGLPLGPDEGRVQVIPVPFEATASFHRGTAGAPSKILEASHQVDLHDLETTDAWRAGISMHPTHPEIAGWNTEASALVQRALRQGQQGGAQARHDVNETMFKMNAMVERASTDVLDAGAIPAILGGDHSVALGGLRAAAQRYPGLGILQVDAHADLRAAYQGFTYSHASVFYNALLECPGLSALVQVGVRDLGRAEWELSESDPRVHLYGWAHDRTRLNDGATFSDIASAHLEPLPSDVWVSFDIDGLEPGLCPGTGTPVPGGLSWDQATSLLRRLATSGRRIVGFDLCEVGTGEWDSNVGARILYKLACWAIRSQG